MTTTILKTMMTMLMALSLFCANAQDAQIDGIYYNLDPKAKTAEVTNLAGGGRVRDSYSGEIVIPASIVFEGITYSVTSIGDNAFFNGSGLTSVTIPNSVTSIGNEAFSQSGLSSITIPNSVLTIGSSAFSYTAWLDNQEDGVVYAGNVVYTYKGTMPENTSITIKEGTSSICQSAFDGYRNLVSVDIPNSVTKIGADAFKYCHLTTVTIPNSITSIENGTFFGCSLTSIDIPNGVTSIGNYAFYECPNLTSINIPNSVESIGWCAFYDCI